MRRGYGCDRGMASSILLLILMVISTGTGTDYRLRKDDEPFIYKNVASRFPQMYPFQSRKLESTPGSEMRMLLGLCKEDRQIIMKSLPAASMASVKQNDTANTVQNIVENMVEVMAMEEENTSSKDKMLPVLKKMTESVNSTMEIGLRMAPQTSNNTTIKPQNTILEILAISGIKPVLPLNCGKHPKKPEDPLQSGGSYPWVAALGSNEDGRFHYRCTGVLITALHILTDADCASSPNINVVMMNVTDAPGPGAVLNYVAGRRVHPAIRDREDLLSGNNIGILELAFPYQFNDYIQPICIAGQFEEPDPNERSEVTIVGFDVKDFPTGRRAGLYNWPKSPTLGSGFCFLALRSLKESNPETNTTLEDILTKKHLCVDRNFELVGKSVILKVHERTGRVRIVGLGGVANAAKTNPIAYTLVQPHRFWVELVINKFLKNLSQRKPITPEPDSELVR